MKANAKVSNRGEAPVTKQFFVTAIDNYFSGWGRARDKKNLLIFLCDSLEEAQRLSKYAVSRPEISHVHLKNQRPYMLSESRLRNKIESFVFKNYFVQVVSKPEFIFWYNGGKHINGPELCK